LPVDISAEDTNETNQPQTGLSFESNEATNQNHLPIDITAIGRGEQVDITLSLRFFDLDLFSANSRRINEAIVEQMYLNRASLGSDLFETSMMVQAIDINEQVANAAVNLNLFSEPVSFGRIGQVDAGDEIPLWVIISVLSSCAVLGFVVARAVLVKKEG